MAGDDWARYWRAESVPVEAMHAHFTSHVYHRHSHESYSFGVTETGAQAFTCRNGRHVSGSGMVMAFNPDDPHDGHAAVDGGFTYRMVHIWPEFFASLTGSPWPLFRSPVIEDPVMAASVRRLHQALTGKASELERYERLTVTARLLAGHASGREPGHGWPPDGEAARNTPDRRVAARIRDLIHETTADLTADDLAVAAGCSRFAAYRAFSRAYGLAPSDYQRQLRIRSARRMLSDGVSLAQAATEAGFADQAHLNRWFRRCYGVTPGAYQAAVLAERVLVGSRTMEQRVLGRTGRPVSVIGLGTWQLGADWGNVSESDAMEVLRTAVESGVTFFDTADVYGDGRSERVIGRFLAGNAGQGIVVATKMGRRVEQKPEHYTLKNFRAWTDRSRVNLGTDRLDLVQLHCPPTAVFASDAVFDALDTLVSEDAIAAYGVSVETSGQALTAIARPGVASVQIILNAFRRKPLDQVLPAAAAAGVGIIARVPLASGLLSGRYTRDTRFASDDHRSYNAHGEAFDVGETFSGVGLEAGADAAAEFATLFNSGARGLPGGTPAQWALRWVIQQPGVTTVIPGARSTSQARQNAEAASLPPLPQAELGAIEGLYDTYFRATVHDRW
jgi:aryl-alcohol dehydrogenase-like predicted oxidoreductase/AraC-like DNA-binding protein